MTDDKIRKAFEEWHRKRYGFVGRTFMMRGNTYYQTQTAQFRWEAWQAAIEHVNTSPTEAGVPE